jgi:hypothetical protein
MQQSVRHKYQMAGKPGHAGRKYFSYDHCYFFKLRREPAPRCIADKISEQQTRHP